MHLSLWIKLKSKRLKKVMNELHVQPVGKGYIDMICPKENIGKFIDEMNRMHIKIIGFTWWCYVTENHTPCGMGGPKNRFGPGWYSEISFGDLIRVNSNEQLRQYLLEVYPSSEAYKPCYTPAFRLEK